ncbi:Predicted PurR-regulated permease PerM [Halomicrobium zhouii]|uniref:Predicted PurR-regulated permease PerM n=1 Tax=Halomicrobium zhouii TaxID=767519 RepID=A0A1I6KCI8_9EURY|nr:AI-2E family transporter [Halomicrobium zhouii]SFR88590.1 Predicted PurR-regulated permease PerM [Halomicrobium zhouii]
MPTRQQLLVLLAVVTGVLTLAILSRVLSTVFFAITVAYVLYPLREFLVGRGVNRRVAAALSTLVAFAAAAALAAPVIWSLYRRRAELLAFLRALPDAIEIGLFDTVYVVDLASAVVTIRQFVTAIAVDVAGETPELGLKLFLFALLVYALLLRPTATRTVVYRTVPDSYHDVVTRLHERIRDTLYAIYVLQGATALGTFLVAFVVFTLLGYDSAFALAALAGILQFVPIIGPSVVILTVAATDVFAGDVPGAIALTVVGLVFVGFLPDAVVRPQLAPYTAGIPGSLYFVGFTGGVLSVGLVGFIAGPLVVALFVESMDLLAAERGPRQKAVQ